MLQILIVLTKFKQKKSETTQDLFFYFYLKK